MSSRLLVIEPNLHLGGHWKPTVQSLARQAGGHGWETVCIAGSAYDGPREMPGFEVVPCLEESPPGWLWPSDGRPAPEHKVREMNARFCDNLGNAPAELVEEAKLVLLPGATVWNVLGAARWLAGYPHVGRIFHVLIPDFVNLRTGRVDGRGRVYREAMDLLLEDPKSTLRVLVQSEAMARRLRSAVGGDLPIERMPHHKAVAPQGSVVAQRARRATPDHPIGIGKLGRLHPDTGLFVLPHVVRRVVARWGDAVRFTIQCRPYAFQLEDRRHAKALDAVRALADLPQIQILEGALPADAWQRTMADLDVVFLPYERQFRFQSSGVFREAMALGLVTVVPRGSSMDAEVHEFGGGGTRFRWGRETSMARALVRAVRDYPDLAPRAQSAAGAWRDRHDPESHMDGLMAAR